MLLLLCVGIFVLLISTTRPQKRQLNSNFSTRYELKKNEFRRNYFFVVLAKLSPQTTKLLDIY